ncbi:DUF4058 family protein [Candidatus Entotheonella palauensis]|uniref:DUF4058 domain-containing protein n=1 Tax=Candidatus Entotheonella gemina TaxID=1429439 RepID=W4MDT2_9BACT|nr:DUF4058 family protein [Candidatus Entotheonella palauensis]ETX08330.1 MAG: hypothetical protein ETSY2_06020 [Candidatus Entotheonella gemina]
MSMIFPGMDPYLENLQVWPDVHASFIVYLREHLRPLLQPRYVIAVESRVFVEGPTADHAIIPDAWVRPNNLESPYDTVTLQEADPAIEVRVAPLEVEEPYITIRDRQSGQRVITVIEVVSPTNKYAGPGRVSYLAKQTEVRKSTAHLVEIDLLRIGPHVMAVPEWAARQHGPYEYLICVNPAGGLRDRFRLYPRGVRQRLPRIRLPLADPDPDTVLDLQAVLARTYEAGGYADRIDYAQPCIPALSPADQAWADTLIGKGNA